MSPWETPVTSKATYKQLIFLGTFLSASVINKKESGFCRNWTFVLVVVGGGAYFLEMGEFFKLLMGEGCLFIGGRWGGSNYWKMMGGGIQTKINLMGGGGSYFHWGWWVFVFFLNASWLRPLDYFWNCHYIRPVHFLTIVTWCHILLSCFMSLARIRNWSYWFLIIAFSYNLR